MTIKVSRSGVFPRYWGWTTIMGRYRARGYAFTSWGARREGRKALGLLEVRAAGSRRLEVREPPHVEGDRADP